MTSPVPCFSEIRGRQSIVPTIEAAARDRSALLLIGPPGSGKSMIARRLPGILPDMTAQEAADVTQRHIAAGLCVPDLDARVFRFADRRPFRAPHHSVSKAGLRGELDLARHGVLFLDEDPEMRREAVETVVQHFARNRDTWLVVAALPCPCGWHGSAFRACACTAAAVARCQGRIAPLRPLLRATIDLAALPFSEVTAGARCEGSEIIRARITRAWGRA